MRIATGKIVNILLCGVLAAAAVYALGRWILPLLLPFLLAWGAAALTEPLVRRLCRRGLPRGAAAGLCLGALLALVGALLWLLLRRLWREGAELTAALPQMSEALSSLLRHWEETLSAFLDRAPEPLRLWTERAVSGLEESLASLPAVLSARLPGLVSGMAARAPEAVLFGITAVLGSFFISASYPALLHGAARLLPERLLCRARLLRRDLRRTLGRWFRAQLIMLAITFGALAAGLLLLRVEYALLLALMTALVDALPVLGSGIVLLPWAACAALTGDLPLGMGLVITYAGVTVLHQSIQAKLLGDQLGLHPLAALCSIYVGFRVWGVWGMLTFPVLAVSLRQLLDSGTLPSTDGTVSRRGDCGT